LTVHIFGLNVFLLTFFSKKVRGAGSPALFRAMAASQALCSPRLYAVFIRSIFDHYRFIEGYFGFGDTNDTAIHFFDFVRL
jgi:hypothetical protein